MSHLTEQNRKDISSTLAHNKKCVKIANAIGCDPTTIAKEIKLNRIISKEARTKGNKILCKRLERFPYVCLACPHKYTSCTLTQLKYDARVAQKKYEFRLHETRKGINLTKEEYDSLNHQLKEGLLNKRSVYEIVKTSEIDISVPTVYRYISEKKMNITKMDLPYAVTYKKRKKINKKYDYPNNRVDRSNRSYLDYLSYRKVRLNEMTVQMDFLGSIKSDSKSILTLIIPELHFVFLAPQTLRGFRYPSKVKGDFL
ncbi:MAG TPA: helix-turn-helix domain-containing protein [Erysipelotrichaceae bacterium]|nr:helix-turn-helix domain-containing protein [Erysipelotrichaceae bacterium]